MNKQEFYNAFMKGVTCAITCLIIFFSVIFCFYAGYKLGRERVLDSETNIVNTSNVQIQSIGLQTMDTSSPNYSFTSSNIYVLYTPFPSNTVSPYEYQPSVGPYPVLFQFNLSSDSSSFSIRGVNHSISNYVYDWWTKFDFLDGPSGNQRKVFAIYYIESGFNFNVTHFDYGTDSTYYGDSRFRTTLITFYDTNGKAFGFQFCYYSSNYNETNLIDRRVYYYTPDFSDTDIYNQGYGVGYDNGLLSGQQLGYNNGYSIGDNVGYNRGYNDGINAGNQYSFSSLLTAVIDAPVHVFIDLLNFDIMGYNLLNLVIGLLTFAIIVLILKLILGGK